MNLSQYKTSTSTKVLILGESGSGKSGSLASLASAGYNLRIVDLERGLDILVNVLKDWKANGYDKDSLSRIDFIPLVDGRSKDGKLSPVNADAWQKTQQAFFHWKSGESDFGPVTTWGEKDVFVLDTLGRLSRAALTFVMYLNNALGQQPDGKKFGAAQGLVDNFLQLLWDPAVSCNIVVLAHVNYQENDVGVQRGFPDTIGKALNPMVGRYFNSVLLAKTKTMPDKTERHVLLTQSTGQIELKTTAPGRVKPEYSLETGLADYFRDVRIA